ncbi:MAG: RidA family protein [Planctomycetaceae bacterium]|nr:MAG: RidA family protein [Planctomycetaceae bacterium]
MAEPTNIPTQGQVQYLNPDGMIRNPAFTQMVITSGPVKTLYIGMQNAVDGSGNIIGKGDIAIQTEQVLKNIDLCLQAGGATREHIVIWRIYVVEGQPIQPAVEAGMRWWGNLPHPPANTVVFVRQITPDFLVGIEAVAVVPL